MYKITRNFIKDTYDKWYNETSKNSKGKIKLSFWYHFNNTVNNIGKFLKGIPTSRDEIYKSEKKDLKKILDKYLSKTSKKAGDDKYNKVKKFKDDIEKDLKIQQQEEKEKVIDVRDKKIKYGLFNRKTKINKPLFPHSSGLPQITDIRQGYTDLDCYFLSVLMASVTRDPKFIIDCFPDYPNIDDKEKIDEFNESKKIKVKFYKVKEEYKDKNIEYSSCGVIIIIVDRTALSSGGAPWVRILEKAYAVYRTKGYDLSMSREKLKELQKIKIISSRIIDGLNGGNPASVMVTITGRPSYEVNWQDRKKTKKFSGYNEDDLKIFEKLTHALNDKKIITASAFKNEKKNIPYAKGLFLDHVYTVIRTDETEDKKWVTVGNPYRGRVREYTKNLKSKSVIPKEDSKKGISKLELNDFCNYFTDIQIS